MLALRLARGALPTVQLRRLLVTAASGGTGFLLLCVLGHALTHPEAPAQSALRLAWCAVPLAATVYFAVTVARTDPGTRPRPGLSAIGLGPGRLMAVSALTTALCSVLGSLLALVLFLYLRGEPARAPFEGDAARSLAPGVPLPLPAALTLLSLVPASMSLAVALTLRPVGQGRWRALAAGRGPLGTRRAGAGGKRRADTAGTAVPGRGRRTEAARHASRRHARTGARRGGNGSHALSTVLDSRDPAFAPADAPGADQDPYASGTPRNAPGGLPWGVAVLALGLMVEAYASRSDSPSGLVVPGGFANGSAGVLAGWLLTALGLVLAGPALTHLCGWLLQAVQPGALRLLAGRVLQEEARRIGRPLGVLCAVASGAFTLGTVYSGTSGTRSSVGPFTVLGGLLVIGCTALTLAIVATEARDSRAHTTAALVRIGAPATMLRSAALLRAGALLALFGPLTLAVAALAAAPLAG
ncbi:hypothetical protein GCM10010145_46440 [Streptomyces ruber]|uniref:Uncharacterized protein n=2 Tax=Streptomyces TaxID=1883 RepID=A0A918BID3_9ACTN|nr:hypothetical protein [Streptomyces ruber]GGQ71356.1 hypothetical protein GCM10010145_46440 [Streptomyces ruber]